jgi:hypothetical protein
MAVTRPHRRVVRASDCVEDAITKEELAKPEIRTPDQVRELSYEQRLQRQIDMLNACMSKYERVTLRGGDLDAEDEKRLMALVDSARKLELALTQIRTRTAGEEGQSDLELALTMVDKGLAVDLVKANFAHNPSLAEELDGALSDRQE